MTGLYRRMVKDMQLRGFSGRTQETYLREVRKLAEHVDKSPGRITEEELREYFLHLKNEHAFSASSMKVAYCGVKFFFTFTLKKKWSTLALVRARKETRLPVVLEVEEVRRIVAAAGALHNRAFLWTVYSCGLRLQEALNLQVKDVDGRRMMLHVHRGKGARDRYVLGYVARYVFRVAISNSRIVSCLDHRVVFTYRDTPTGRTKTCRLEALEFIRRFLQHVLPRGFTKVRHYGFLNPNSRHSIDEVRDAACRRLEVEPRAARARKPAADARVVVCPRCGRPMKFVATTRVPVANTG